MATRRAAREFMVRAASRMVDLKKRRQQNTKIQEGWLVSLYYAASHDRISIFPASEPRRRSMSEGSLQPLPQRGP